MKTNLFKKEYIKKEIEMAKDKMKHSLFHTHLEHILREQEEFESLASNLQDMEKEESALPPEDTKPVLQLTKLAVEALFVDPESLYSELSRDAMRELNKLRPIQVADSSKALSLIRTITQEAKIPTSSVFDLDKVDFSSKNILINLISQCIFLSKDDLLQSDPSLSSLLEKVSDDFTQLKDLEEKDPIEALKLADQIQENIKKIISSASLTI